MKDLGRLLWLSVGMLLGAAGVNVRAESLRRRFFWVA